MAFTDIIAKNWMLRCPASIRPYLYLLRLDRPIGWWLLLLPGWWSILLASDNNITAYTCFLLGLFWAGAIIMRGAGCVINDLWDRDLDKHVERTAARPIVAGQISIEDALIFLCLLLLMGLFILLLLPPLSVFLGVLSLPFIILYPLMKRFTWWPQAFLGITFNFGALIGWTAVTGDLPLTAFILYIAAFFWTLGYDTIYAHQDREDDLRIGIKSTALLFGHHSRLWVYEFYGAALVFFNLALLLSPPGWISFLLLLLVYAFTAWRLTKWDPNNQDSSLEMFKDNKIIGLMIFLALAL